MKSKGARPQQRTQDLVVRPLGEETLVLDRRTDTAHSLPAQVSRVWVACTGTNSLTEIASVAGIDEAAAASAVDQLMERDLIEVPAGVDRRNFMRRTALVGAGAVTVTGITSVVGPMATAAASPDIEVPEQGTAGAPTCTGSAGGPTDTSILFSTLLLTGFTPGVTYMVVATYTGPPPPPPSPPGTQTLNFGTVTIGPGGTSNPSSADTIVSPADVPLPQFITIIVTLTEISPNPNQQLVFSVMFENPCCTASGGACAMGTSNNPSDGTRTSLATHPPATSSPAASPTAGTATPRPTAPSPTTATSSHSPAAPTSSPSASP